MSIAAIGLGIGAGLWWLASDEPQRNDSLHINRAGKTATHDFPRGIIAQLDNVVPDDLRRKYDPLSRGEFHLASSQDTSIFVLATGVQIRTPSGWKMATEEYRGEIWRLKPGIPREVCIERPHTETWRAYIRYGTEMKGSPLLKAKLREAWTIRSFSNWTGKAWGGGRYSGSYELVSEEIKE
jgi:hypothetical protein